MTKQIRFVDGALEKYKLTTPIEPIVAIVLNIFLNDIQLFQRPCGTSAQIQLRLPTLKTVCNSFIQWTMLNVSRSRYQLFEYIHKEDHCSAKNWPHSRHSVSQKVFSTYRSLFAPEHPWILTLSITWQPEQPWHPLRPLKLTPFTAEVAMLPPETSRAPGIRHAQRGTCRDTVDLSVSLSVYIYPGSQRL